MHLPQTTFRKLSASDQDFGALRSHSVAEDAAAGELTRLRGPGPANALCVGGPPMAWPGRPARSRMFLISSGAKGALAREWWSRYADRPTHLVGDLGHKAHG